MIMGGSTLIRRDSAVPMRSLPETSSGSRVMPWALRTPSRISSAWGKQPLPRLGQPDVLADAVEQLGVQLLLQLFDLHRHRRLGITQLSGGFGKILQLRYAHKGNNVPNLHGSTYQNF